MKTPSKLLLISLLFGSSVALSTAYAESLVKCEMGTACAVTAGKKAMYTVTPDVGVNFSCVVTADDAAAPITFTVGSSGKYEITTGAGDYEANPTVTVDIQGSFVTKNPKAKVKGKLLFTNVDGGSGTVTCQPV